MNASAKTEFRHQRVRELAGLKGRAALLDAIEAHWNEHAKNAKHARGWTLWGAQTVHRLHANGEMPLPKSADASVQSAGDPAAPMADRKGRAHYLVPKEKAAEILGDKGVSDQAQSRGRSDYAAQQQRQREFTHAFRDELLTAAFAAARKALLPFSTLPADFRKLLSAVLLLWLDQYPNDDSCATLAKVLGIAGDLPCDPGGKIMKEAKPADYLPMLLWLWADEKLSDWDIGRQAKRFAAAFGIDLKVIKKRAQAALKAAKANGEPGADAGEEDDE